MMELISNIDFTKIIGESTFQSQAVRENLFTVWQFIVTITDQVIKIHDVIHQHLAYPKHIYMLCAAKVNGFPEL